MKYTIMKYLRVSLEDIDLDGADKYESNSIQNQRAYLNDFIARTPEFEGCEILEELDDGKTGTNFARAGVQRVIELAQSGKIQCVIVKDLSRWGRNYIEVGDYLEQKFPSWGVRFISVNDMYDSATLSGGTGGIDIAFRNLIYELYSRDLSEKVRSARQSAAKSGKFVSPYAPYGYVKDPSDRRKLAVDETAAATVKLIYNMAEQGKSTGDIAKMLNAECVSTPQQRKRELGERRNWVKTNLNYWDDSTVAVILRDERYTGKLIYGKSRRIDIGSNAIRNLPENEWVTTAGAIPALVSAEQFAAVRRIVESKCFNHKTTKSGALFAGKIKCGHCGHALSKLNSRDKIRYGCAVHLKTSNERCFAGSIAETDLAEYALTALQQQAALAVERRERRKATAKSAMPTVANLRDKIQNLQRSVEQFKTTKMTLWERYHANEISRETFQRGSGNFTAQIMEAENKITQLETQAQTFEAAGREISPFEERCHIGITELTREIVQEFIKRVNVYAPDRIEVVFNFADEYEKTLTE